MMVGLPICGGVNIWVLVTCLVICGWESQVTLVLSLVMHEWENWLGQGTSIIINLVSLDLEAALVETMQ
jgi:hypothetical protein